MCGNFVHYCGCQWEDELKIDHEKFKQEMIAKQKKPKKT